MPLWISLGLAAWAGVYTGSLWWAFWRRRKYRSAVGVALLWLMLAVSPFVLMGVAR